MTAEVIGVVGGGLGGLDGRLQKGAVGPGLQHDLTEVRSAGHCGAYLSSAAYIVAVATLWTNQRKSDWVSMLPLNAGIFSQAFATVPSLESSARRVVLGRAVLHHVLDDGGGVADGHRGRAGLLGRQALRRVVGCGEADARRIDVLDPVVRATCLPWGTDSAQMATSTQ